MLYVQLLDNFDVEFDHKDVWLDQRFPQKTSKQLCLYYKNNRNAKWMFENDVLNN